MNKVAKGRRKEKKVLDWLHDWGLAADRCRVSGSAQFGAQDFWGADILASGQDRLLAIQVKSNKADVARGIKALQEAPWPSSVHKFVILWEDRKPEPELFYVKEIPVDKSGMAGVKKTGIRGFFNKLLAGATEEDDES